MAFLFGAFTGAQIQREAPYDQLVLNVRASYRQETATAVDFFTEKLACHKVCGYWQNDSYGMSGRDGVVRRLKAKNLPLTAEQTYERGALFDSDFSKQAQALKQAGCECIVMVGAYNGCGGFIRQIREMGWYVPVDNVSFVGATQMLRFLWEVELTRNHTLTDNLFNTQVVPNIADSGTTVPVVREYRVLRHKYAKIAVPNSVDACCGPSRETWVPADESLAQLEGFLNAKLFVEILKAAGKNPTRESFKAAAVNYSGDLGGFKGRFGVDPKAPDKPANQFSSEVFVTYTRPGSDWMTVQDWKGVLSHPVTSARGSDTRTTP